VLVPWDGAIDAAPTGRSRAQARDRAEEARRAIARGTPFAEVARVFSEDPSAGRGGALGVYQVGTMVPDFENEVAAIEIGSMTPVFETPFGWAFARRDPVIEARFSHIQIGHMGAWRSSATRTPDEAREKIESLRRDILGGLPFDRAATTWSEDPSTAKDGGDLGLVAPGQLVPAFEDAAFGLQPGELSSPVASPYGWHLILRAP
jgi:peptidyl-prolyl cis-trans isomerase SurA